jgi:hypothetical protein
MQISKKEIVITLFGISISILIFFSQGPYDNWWQYALPFLPLILALILAIIFRILLSSYGLRKTLSILREKYDLITSIRGSSQMVVRIINEQGDVDYEREYHLELIKSVPITSTKQEHISSTETISTIPPSVELLYSSIQPQSLIPEGTNQQMEQIAGKLHTHYSWRYKISNPLRKAGDKLDYRYKISIPKSESSAFSDAGSLLYLECGAIFININMCLISPPGYAIDIIEYKTTDYDGSERPLKCEMTPVLNAANEVLTWCPPYAHGIRYICRYRCIKKK